MSVITLPSRRPARLLDRLRADTSAMGLLEFSFTLPIILAIGGYGIELSNLALSNLDVSQYALTLADNASRVGVDSGLSTYQLREFDINDAFQGTRLASTGLKLTTFGRVTLSSLEFIQQSYDTAPVRRIHWQRCIGLKNGAGYDSTYGTTPTSAGSTATSADAGVAPPTPAGMGDAGTEVLPPAGSGLMFVEINYDYQPLFKTMFLGPTKIHYIASFIVRDRRDFSRIWNPENAAQAKCNVYAV